MAWLYVPESAGSSLDSSSPSETPTAVWATSSGKPSPRPSSWPGWKTRPWIERLSGTISRPSTAARGAVAWISSLPATRASRSASPGIEAASPTRATSGRTSGGSSTRSSRGWSFSKTSQATFPWASTASSETLPPSGSMRSGVCSERTMSAPRTDGSGSGAWPTATVTSGAQTAENPYPNQPGGTTLPGAALKHWPTASAQTYGTNQGGSAGRVGPLRPSLDTLARGWNTPRASMAAKGGNPTRKQPRDDLEAQARGWATPNASDSFVGEIRTSPEARERQLHRGYDNGSKRTSAGSLAKDVAAWPTLAGTASETEACGLPAPQTCTHGGACKPTLNPRFVEWLMGFPIGWTDFGRSETAWSLWLRRMRSELSRLGLSGGRTP